MLLSPETRYVRTAGGIHIAYQTLGDHGPDVVFIAGFTSHCEHQWEQPSLARSLRRIGSFGRLIWFDKRGTGLSDPVPASELSLEERMQDLRAVLDAVGSNRAALFGASDGGPLCALYAATYPERVSALVLYGTWARFFQGDGYPLGMPPEAFEPVVALVEAGWGTGEAVKLLAPSAAGDRRTVEWWARWERLSSSPGTAAALVRVMFETDVRSALPAIQAPTLVLHRSGDPFAPVAHGRYLADHIAGARLVELPGCDHPHFVGDVDAVMDEIQQFLVGERGDLARDRVLTTVMFSDIVGSTGHVSARGDSSWRELLQTYCDLTEREVAKYGGRLIKSMGDGHLATFDGPARAVRCARSIREAASGLGLNTRAGVHTGEVELVGEDILGITVHVGARVSSAAGPGEVLVTRTVKDLVAGSGLEFVDKGVQVLRGVPDPWHVYTLAA